jgi:hypothetical protein
MLSGSFPDFPTGSSKSVVVGTGDAFVDFFAHDFNSLTCCSERNGEPFTAIVGQ